MISEIENSEILTNDICKGKDGEEINSQCYWFYMTTQTPPIMLRNEKDSIANINMSMFSI